MSREVFLCVKQGLALEIDVHQGRERCRMELSSLVRVEPKEAAWTRGVRGGEREVERCVFSISKQLI